MPKLSLSPSVVTLDLDIDDIDKALLLYDSFQVWRSPDNIVSYTELTGSDDLPASLSGTIDGPWNLNTKTLTIIKNNADPITITFSVTNPIDLQSLIIYINNIVPKLASQVGTNINRLKLTSDITGLASNLTLSGNATATLGLSTTKIIGKTHRQGLVSPTTKYKFYDLDGLSTYYYKIRLYNSINGAASAFSSIIQGSTQPILDNGDLVTASITLTDSVGNPVESRRVIIVPMVTKKIGSNSLLSTQDRIILTTNQFGVASTKLARGITVRVFFEGTGFEREFVVPDTDFDILTVASTYPDPFSIVTTPPLAVRIS